MAASSSASGSSALFTLAPATAPGVPIAPPMAVRAAPCSRLALAAALPDTLRAVAVRVRRRRAAAPRIRSPNGNRSSSGDPAHAPFLVMLAGARGHPAVRAAVAPATLAGGAGGDHRRDGASPAAPRAAVRAVRRRAARRSARRDARVAARAQRVATVAAPAASALRSAWSALACVQLGAARRTAVARARRYRLRGRATIRSARCASCAQQAIARQPRAAARLGRLRSLACGPGGEGLARRPLRHRLPAAPSSRTTSPSSAATTRAGRRAPARRLRHDAGARAARRRDAARPPCGWQLLYTDSGRRPVRQARPAGRRQRDAPRGLAAVPVIALPMQLAHGIRAA